MLRNVLSHDHAISLATLVLTGATEIRDNFKADQIPTVVNGYMAGLKVVFAMCIACTGLSVLISLLVRWKKLNQDTTPAVAAAA